MRNRNRAVATVTGTTVAAGAAGAAGAATEESTLSRQSPLSLHLPKAVAVIGAGGVGSWVVVMLAMAGVKEIWVFDFDTVSEHNRNRLPVRREDVGRRKVEAVGDLVRRLRPGTTVMEMGGFDADLADSLELDKSVGWVVVTTDTWDSRRAVEKWARGKKGVRYIEAAAEGEVGSATGEAAEWATEEERNPGYASVPAWVGPCVFGAAVAVAHVLHDTEMGGRVVRAGWDREMGRFGVFDSGEVVGKEERGGGDHETSTAGR